MKRIYLLCFTVFFTSALSPAQTSPTGKRPPKVSHAEPLFADLIRDIGARKGEREWNAGWSVNDAPTHVTHNAFLEYEFAPVNRLGFEVEVPFGIAKYPKTNYSLLGETAYKLLGVKLAAQYTFFVSPERQLSMAAGHIYDMELEMFPGARWGSHSFNPFLVLAKRWGSSIHTLLYTGPVYQKQAVPSYLFNISAHYVLPDSHHFIGLEWNAEIACGKTTQNFLRPQVKINLSNQLAIGFVTGIPLHVTSGNLSFMTRIIYEPARKK